MAQNNKIISIILVLLLAVFLQVLFVFADTQETPEKAAKTFAKAYFKYDRDTMIQRLCEESRMADDVNVVNAYLHRAWKEAKGRGYSLGYMKDYLYGLKVETLEGDYNHAKVRVTAERKNPLRSFFGGSSHHVEETFDLVKEDGQWRVCGNPFSLSEA